MGDPRRFDAFARLIEHEFDPTWTIADVAGGKGILQAALRERGFHRITTWDRRRRTVYSRHGHRYGYFTHTTAARYDALLAMHPDEASDHAILYAGHHQIPALLCPCCVRPSAIGFWKAAQYHLWCAHLEQLARDAQLHVTWTTLPIYGRRDVMILRPRLPATQELS